MPTQTAPAAQRWGLKPGRLTAAGGGWDFAFNLMSAPTSPCGRDLVITSPERLCGSLRAPVQWRT
jgi:hypothetical protein